MPFTPYAPQKSGFTPYNPSSTGGLNKVVAPTKPSLPLTTDGNSASPIKNFVSAAKDESVGVVKGAIGSTRSVASMLQGLGQRVIARVKTPFGNADQFDEKLAEVKKGPEIKSLDDSTLEGKSVSNLLESKSIAEKTGKGIEVGAEIAAGFSGGTAEELLSKGKSVVKNIGEFFGKGSKAELNDLVEATKGVADKKARISTLEKTGAIDKDGNPIGGAKQSLFGGVKTTPTPQELSRAKSVQGIVKANATPVENLTNLNQAITKISEEEVGPALKKAGNVSPISEKTPGWSKITQRLVDIEKPDIIKADATLDKTYDLVRQRMIEQIQKQPPTYEGLWDARKSFDKVVEDQFGDAAFNSEKNTAIKRAISDMRREINNIIGEGVPEYKPQMDKLTDLYDARYNIAEQFQNLTDKGGWKAFKTLNPKSAALLKWGSGLVGIGATEEIIRRKINN